MSFLQAHRDRYCRRPGRAMSGSGAQLTMAGLQDFLLSGSVVTRDPIDQWSNDGRAFSCTNDQVSHFIPSTAHKKNTPPETDEVSWILN